MAIILAAGKGTRMQSDLPKVLVPVLGKPMVRYVINALRDAGVNRIVLVVGYRSELVRNELADQSDLLFVDQTDQLGTGHAVMMCREQLATHAGPVLIVAGDSPMLQTTTIRQLLQYSWKNDNACLLGTVLKEDPTGLGRIVRERTGKFVGIVEEKDATDQQRALQEVNASTYLFDASCLLHSLDRLTNDNAQQEYYITDCPGILLAEGQSVEALNILQPCEALSINNMDDLHAVHQEMERMGTSLRRSER